ncbi:hypothetical protein Sste5346_000071 [Sporothrix stenoceras]|uniref:Uncharacterized protein n=1 Tax=Sporothrix stenoceras TaxID=5173 RepID=A0ABR3ZSH1_9PEZI
MPHHNARPPGPQHQNHNQRRNNRRRRARRQRYRVVQQAQPPRPPPPSSPSPPPWSLSYVDVDEDFDNFPYLDLEEAFEPWWRAVRTYLHCNPFLRYADLDTSNMTYDEAKMEICGIPPEDTSGPQPPYPPE